MSDRTAGIVLMLFVLGAMAFVGRVFYTLGHREGFDEGVDFAHLMRRTLKEMKEKESPQ